MSAGAVGRAALLLAALCLAMPARAEPLRVLAAGSLREAIAAIAADFQARTGIAVMPVFGPSGLLRERIEGGEKADVLASADMGHPRKLAAAGLAGPVVLFARNTMCAFARADLGLTPATVLDRLLDPAVRLGTAAPKADPLGDYTWQLFALADRLRPGARATLEAKAEEVTGGAATSAPVNGQDRVVAGFAAGTIGIYLGYCSGAARFAALTPAVVATALPPDLQVGPEYGIAVLKDAAPEAATFVLHVLSADGQRRLAEHGLAPVALPRKD